MSQIGTHFSFDIFCIFTGGVVECPCAFGSAGDIVSAPIWGTTCQLQGADSLLVRSAWLGIGFQH